MPKPKQFVKENKKKVSKHAPQTPQTADEYLAAGVDLEEAGEKWRGGDAAKSARFFVRAINTYEEALRLFPLSFDLAYNKARVQYELTQHPRLATQLPGSLLDLLKTALESSRAALNLRQDNADVLFNTAQVLTSLVEALTEDRSGSTSKEDGLRLLEEAIELFQRCLTLQEFHHAESQAQEESADAKSQLPEVQIPDSEATSSEATSTHTPTDSSAPTEGRSSQTSQQVEEEEVWAAVVEPVTNDTLLDTILAQLETLTLLSELITADEGRGLAWIEEYSASLLTNKLPAYIIGTDREEEAALTRANFIAGLANANFRCDRMDAATYQRALEDAFGNLDLDHDPEGLCDKAEALIAYSTALGTKHPYSSSATTTSDPQHTLALTNTRWTALTTALTSLTQATKTITTSTSTTTPHNLPTIHLLRGDVELLRYQLSQPPTLYAPAIKSAPTLLKNAATYYRGAERAATAAATRDEDDVAERAEATVKLAIVEALAGGDGDAEEGGGGGGGEGKKRLRELLAGSGGSGGNGGGDDRVKVMEVQKLVEEAVEAGLVGIEWLVREGIVGGEAAASVTLSY